MRASGVANQGGMDGCHMYLDLFVERVMETGLFRGRRPGCIGSC